MWLHAVVNCCYANRHCYIGGVEQLEWLQCNVVVVAVQGDLAPMATPALGGWLLLKTAILMSVLNVSSIKKVQRQ